jgi:hypothetical protein
MGGKSSSAPDPTQTANAQAKYDKGTAAFNAALNRYNTYTPLGNQTWTTSGNDPATGAPVYSQQINLSPNAQATLDSNQANARGLSNTQGQLLANTAYGLSQPIDTSGVPALQNSVNNGDLAGLANKATQASYDSNMALLDPQFKQTQESTRAQLANQGLAPGSEAYENAMGNMNRQQDWTRTQAANQATLTGQGYQNQLFNQGLSNANLNNSTQGQYLSQLLALHDQPLNEYNSLMSGSQVQMPSFQATQPVGNISSPNYAQMVQNNANAQAGADNSFTSGLFGLGAAGLGAAGKAALFSDRRLKTNIERVGTHKLGIGIYDYDIFGERQRGVMAQELEQVMPAAVVEHPSGYKMVNYSMIG